MAINADTLLDRIYLKSQLHKWRVLAVLFAVVALIVVIDRHSPHGSLESFVARVSIEGIVDDNQEMYDLIDDLAENPRAKAVIIRLNTPGGSAVGGEETYYHLRQLAQKKPVVAVMRSVSASAGYMVAIGTDYIIAREGTITGSIGALAETAEFTELADKLGIKPIIVKSGPLKASPNPLEKATPESIRVLQDVINDFYGRFVDMVAERRNLPRAQVLKLADGSIYSGKRALEYQLIDALGGEDTAMEWLVSQRHVKPGLDIRDVEPPEDLGIFKQLTESMSGYFFQKGRVGLDGIQAIWHPQLR